MVKNEAKILQGDIMLFLLSYKPNLIKKEIKKEVDGLCRRVMPDYSGDSKKILYGLNKFVDIKFIEKSKNRDYCLTKKGSDALNKRIAELIQYGNERKILQSIRHYLGM